MLRELALQLVLFFISLFFFFSLLSTILHFTNCLYYVCFHGIAYLGKIIKLYFKHSIHEKKKKIFFLFIGKLNDLNHKTHM